MTAADVSELLPLARVMEGRDGRSEASLDFLSKPGVASHGTDDLDNISLKRSDDDETEPCCQKTGPCQWDKVCQTHVGTWEASHGENYLAFLTRTGAVVPEWLRQTGAVPGQRGSASAVATAGVDLEPKEEDIGLSGNGGNAALVEVAGRGEADGEPMPFGEESVMDLDDEDDEYSAPISAPSKDPLSDPMLAAAIASGSEARDAVTGALTLDEHAIE